jgi:lipopolysaccharide transport system ATP-binding protein
VWLEQGQIVDDGPAEAVVTAYQQSIWQLGPERAWENGADAPGNQVVRLRRARVRTRAGDTAEAVNVEQPVGVELTYEVLEAGHILIPNCHFYNDQQLKLFAVQDVHSEWRRQPRPTGTYVTTLWLPGNFLNEGTLIVDVAVSSHRPDIRVHFFQKQAVAFHIYDSLNGNSARGDYAGTIDGVVRPVVDWETQVGAP